MEALEESQINDRSVIEATVIERQAHSGRMRFKTKLPSGREIESNWVQESDKAKAGIQWVEAVRGQIVADSSEAANRARQGLKELRATAPPAAPKLFGADGSALTAMTPGLSTPAVAPLPTPTAAPVASPLTYVKAQHAAADRRLEELATERQRVNFEYAEAQKAEAQWFGLLQAMGGAQIEDSFGGVSSGAAVSSGISPVSPDEDDTGGTGYPFP